MKRVNDVASDTTDYPNYPGDDSDSCKSEAHKMSFEQEREMIRRARSRERIDRQVIREGDSSILEAKINAALQRNSELILAIKRKETEIEDLRTSFDTEMLNEEVDQLQEQVVAAIAETEAIRAQNLSLAREVDEYEDELQNLKTAEADLAAKTTLLSNILAKLTAIKQGVSICLGLKLVLAAHFKLQRRQVSSWFDLLKQDNKKDTPNDLGVQLLCLKQQMKQRVCFLRLRQVLVRSNLTHFSKSSEVKSVYMDEILKRKLMSKWVSFCRDKNQSLARQSRVLHNLNRIAKKVSLANFCALVIKSTRASYQIMFPQTQAAFVYFKHNLHASAAASHRRRRMAQPGDDNEIEEFNYCIKIFNSLITNHLAARSSSNRVNLKHFMTKGLAFVKVVKKLQRFFNRKVKQRYVLAFFKTKEWAKKGLKEELSNEFEQTEQSIEEQERLVALKTNSCRHRHVLSTLLQIFKTKKQAVFAHLKRTRFNINEIRQQKVEELSKYIQLFTREKLSSLKRHAFIEIRKSLEARKKSDYEEINREVIGLKSDLMKIQIESRNENKKLMRTRLRIFTETLGRLITYRHESAYWRLKQKSQQRQSIEMGLQVLQCTKPMLNRRLQVAVNMMKQKRQVSKVACIDRVIRQMILRDLFKLMRHGYYRHKERVKEKLSKLYLLIEVKLHRQMCFALDGVFQMKEEYLDRHVKDLTNHIGETQSKLAAATASGNSLNQRINQINKSWLSKVFRTAETEARYRSFVAVVRASRLETGCWGMRFLAKKVNLIRRARIGTGFAAIAAGKMVIGVYELETKRDDAFTNLNDIKKSLAEDYESFNTGLNLHSLNKSSSLSTLDGEKNLTWKLSISISRLPLKKIQAAYFQYLKKKVEYYNSFKKPLHSRKKLLAAFFDALLQETNLPISKGLRKLHRAVAKLVRNQFRKTAFILRENSNEKALKALSYKILKKKKDVETEEKVTRERKEKLAREGPGCSNSGLWFEQVGRVFRAWRARKNLTKQKNTVVGLALAENRRRLLQACFRAVKSLVVKPARVLQPLCLRQSRHVDPLFVKMPLVRSLLLNITGSCRAKASCCLKKLARFNRSLKIHALFRLAAATERLLRSKFFELNHFALSMMRRRCVVMARMKLADLAGLARLRRIQRAFFNRMKVLLPSEINPKVLLQTKLRKVKCNATARNPHLLLKLVQEWQRVARVTRLARRRLSRVAQAFRTWKWFEVDEFADPIEEYPAVRELLAEARLFGRKERDRLAQIKRKIRSDIVMMVQGSTANLVELMQKLRRANVKQGFERIRFFSGGPMLVEAKIALRAMSKQLIRLEKEKDEMQSENEHLDSKVKKSSLDMAELRRILADKIELEEKLAKVSERIQEKHRMNLLLRDQTVVARTEKQRLLSILSTMT